MPSPAKLLLVANTDWYLYNFRLQLARAACAAGYSVLLVSPPGPYVAELRRLGFEWREWNFDRRSALPWSEWQTLSGLNLILAEEKPELVHFFTIKPVLYGSLLAKWHRNLAVVNSITGLGYLFLQRGIWFRFLQAVIWQLYRLAFSSSRLRVIFENADDLQLFIRQGALKPGQACVIRGVGVDTDYFVPAPHDDDPALIVLPARMLWDKGVGTLVEAAHKMRLAGCKARVALVGDVDDGNPASISALQLQNWVNEGVVEWWGFQQDMRSVYQQARIVCLPSFGEGMPTALLEAAACARPIVTTDVPGCREVIEPGKTGLLVPPGDPDSLKQALCQLIEDRDWCERMGMAGRQRAVEQFDYRIVVKETLAVYQQLRQWGG
jgi:glycosyltransferase involved in cell wall biosynthesis